ncbi:MAG TPA: hypothetical protein VGM88_00400 [Kofleriaceae bacterium]|jgi:hypothetical protein
MRRSVLALVALTTLGTEASARGFLLATLPTETDLGQGMASNGQPEQQVLVGLSWASLFWKPTRFDFSFGYMGSFQAMPGKGPPVAFRTLTPTTPTNNVVGLNGVYLAMARTIYHRKHVRTWLSARGELLGGDFAGRDLSVMGEALRVSTEIFACGKAAAGGGGSFAGFSGAVAVGFYVEAEHRDVPDALGPDSVSTGISIRLPLAAIAAR